MFLYINEPEDEDPPPSITKESAEVALSPSDWPSRTGGVEGQHSTRFLKYNLHFLSVLDPGSLKISVKLNYNLYSK